MIIQSISTEGLVVVQFNQKMFTPVNSTSMNDKDFSLFLKSTSSNSKNSLIKLTDFIWSVIDFN